MQSSNSIKITQSGYPLRVLDMYVCRHAYAHYFETIDWYISSHDTRLI
jgi:hypothetical protein